ncbi:MAG: hypothetical protein WCO26_15030 [Deltaproteobacteria bacterium]
MTTQNLLGTALKTAEPVIQECIRDLTEENNQLKMKHAKSIKEKAKFKIKISELEIENDTYKKKILELQKALNKSKSEGGGIVLNIKSSKPSSYQSEK